MMLNEYDKIQKQDVHVRINGKILMMRRNVYLTESKGSASNVFLRNNHAASPIH